MLGPVDGPQWMAQRAVQGHPGDADKTFKVIL